MGADKRRQQQQHQHGLQAYKLLVLYNAAQTIELPSMLDQQPRNAVRARTLESKGGSAVSLAEQVIGVY